MKKFLFIPVLFVFGFITILAQPAAPVDRIELPKPSGKYKVGTVVQYWADKKREEQWSKTFGNYRELMVQIWYPADVAIESQKAPYVFDFEKLKASIDKYRANAGMIRTGASVGVPLSIAEKKYPVIIFSHGMNSARFTYTSFCQELASHGFVVAAIDHTYWGPGVTFPNGKIVGIDDGMIGRDKLSSDDIDRMMRVGINVMVADQQFVAEKLAELNRTDKKLFKNRLEMAQIGSIGHSMGGMAATRACLEYTAFKACVSLDGPNYFLDMMPERSQKPFLLLLNSDWGRRAPEKIRKSYLEAWSNPTVAIVNGTKHDSFSDVPFITRIENKPGMTEPLRAFQVICAYVVSFLEKNLKQTSADLRDFPELEFIDLKALKD